MNSGNLAIFGIKGGIVGNDLHDAVNNVYDNV